MEALLILIFICSRLTLSDTSFAVDLQCPERFKNGANIVNCTINSTAVREAECLSVSESVTFDRTIGSQTTAVCACTYDPNQQCNSSTQNSPGSCWCSRSGNGILTYSFSYQANSKLDQGGQLECKICVLPEKNFHQNIHSGCRSMSFDEYQKKPTTPDGEHHNSSVVGELTNEKAGKDPKSDDSDDPNNSAVIGAVIGAVAGIILIAAVIFFVFFKKHKKCCCSSSKKDKSSEIKFKDDEEIEMLKQKNARNHQNRSVLKETDDSLGSLRGFESEDEKERGKMLPTIEERTKNQQNGTALIHM